MPFASDDDYGACRLLHRKHGTTYFLASRAFQEPIRTYTDAVYGFVREVDEWVDNPGGMDASQIQAAIQDYRDQLSASLLGECPKTPVLRAFVDVLIETSIPMDEPLCFLDAMEMDLTLHRYQTYQNLCAYMRGSAASVAIMMCYVSGTIPTQDMASHAESLAYAMQMTNFLRDIPEDADRGRIYLPIEDLNRFQVEEDEILQGQFSDRFKYLVEYEMAKTRQLYADGEAGIPLLPKKTQKAVTIARILYGQILDQLANQDCNPYLGRARTTKGQKLAAIVKYGVLGKRLA